MHLKHYLTTGTYISCSHDSRSVWLPSPELSLFLLILQVPSIPSLTLRDVLWARPAQYWFQQAPCPAIKPTVGKGLAQTQVSHVDGTAEELCPQTAPKPECFTLKKQNTSPLFPYVQNTTSFDITAKTQIGKTLSLPLSPADPLTRAIIISLNMGFNPQIWDSSGEQCSKDSIYVADDIRDGFQGYT